MRAAAARFLLALFVCAMLFAGPAAAQTQTTPASAVEDASGLEYAEWETLADRAEEALEAGRASDEAFEALREELVQWRGRLLAAQSINQSRIVTLRAQLDALGPVPEEGITEPEEIAERRLELDTQLARMEAPVLRADEAFLRADGLIREIDILIRTRQTEALTRTGPSPLNPANWATALQEVSGTVASVGQEVVDALSNQTQRQAGENNLPLAVFYLLVAALLLVRGKAWVARLCAQAAQFQSVNLRNLSAVVFSLGHVVLPYVAVLAVVQAVDTVDILGLRGTRILALIPQAALTVLAARWLAGQMVPVQTSAQALIDVPAAERFRARLSIASLGVIVALGQLIVGIAYVDDFSEATIAVTSYPLVVVAALFLFRVGRRLNSIATAEADPAVRNFRHTMLRTVGRATLVLAFAAP